MDFLGIGTGELMVILVVTLIFIGPEKMVGAARTMGKFTSQFTHAGKEFSRKLEEEVNLESQARELREAGRELTTLLNETPSQAPGAKGSQKTSASAAANSQTTVGRS